MYQNLKNNQAKISWPGYFFRANPLLTKNIWWNPYHSLSIICGQNSIHSSSDVDGLHACRYDKSVLPCQLCLCPCAVTSMYINHGIIKTNNFWPYHKILHDLWPCQFKNCNSGPCKSGSLTCIIMGIGYSCMRGNSVRNVLPPSSIGDYSWNLKFSPFRGVRFSTVSVLESK